MSNSIEGWQIIKPDGTFEALDLLDEWTFWAWCQGAEERFLWRLQSNTVRKIWQKEFARGKRCST